MHTARKRRQPLQRSMNKVNHSGELLQRYSRTEHITARSGGKDGKIRYNMSNTQSPSPFQPASQGGVFTTDMLH
ncbi:hypothetical protein QQF64_026783 [Cirrhinus molitorella]|uniref:Uncharacterized protein n=2 Tax=Cirrhinus molitorella TaxID=172907 RepID=A0ABR3NAS2_9TELE|nr:hypothetical protein Q8A67_003259 [Cirrhinus molitorella]